MADIKFGLNQISQPTPKWATNAFRIVLYTAAAGGIIVSGISEIPVAVKVIVLKYCIEAAATSHALSKLFGIKLPDVPAPGDAPK